MGRPLFQPERGEGGSGFAWSPARIGRLSDELVEGVGEEEEEEEDGGSWKAAWARRFARGAIHSEYQDNFLWPRRSRTRTTPVRVAPKGGAAAGVVAVAPGPVAAVVPPEPAYHEGTLPLGRGDGGGEGGGAKGEDTDTAPAGAGAGAGAADEETCQATAVPRAPPSRQRRRPSEAASSATCGRDAKGYRWDDRVHATASAAAAVATAALETGASPELEVGVGEAWADEEVAVSGSHQASEKLSTWEVVDHVNGVCDEDGRGSGLDAEAWQSGRAGGAAQDRREAAKGRAKATMLGGRTIDYSSQVVVYLFAKSGR